MHRRSLLKLLGLTGLTALAPRRSWAGPVSPRHAGPYILTVHAGGGWDPTLLCDPKGRIAVDQPDAINNYYVDEIVEAGGFRVAPVEGVPAFFERWGSRFLVLNGVDTGTNSHQTGTRVTWSGATGANAPNLGAVYAATQLQIPPLAYLANGGYDVTNGLVPATRLPDASAIDDLAWPLRLDGDDPESGIHPASVQALIDDYRAGREQRQLSAARLPAHQDALVKMLGARAGENELAELRDALPELDDSNNPLLRQAQVAMACFSTGISVAAGLSLGGFDTHGNHDANHIPRLQMLLEGVSFALEEAERQGIADQLYVLVGSDFARTPGYNDGNGKDHWSITSMMLSGPGIRGGRVIGATDERQLPRLIDPQTLAIDDAGVPLTPGAIHASLRELLGIADDPVSAEAPVGDPLPLFA